MRRWIGLAAVTMFIGGALLLRGHSHRASEGGLAKRRTAVQSPRLGCALPTGEDLAYELSVSTETQGGQLPGVIRQSLQARLALRVLRQESGGDALLAATFHDVTARGDSEYWSGLRAQAGVPFALRLGADCAQKSIGFWPTFPESVRAEVRSLLDLVQFSVERSRSGTWSAQHRDDSGRYVADYRLIGTPSGSQPGGMQPAGMQIEKRRLHYQALSDEARQAGVQVQIVESRSRLSLDGRWLSSFAGRERVRLTQNHQRLMEMSAAVQLQAQPDAKFPLPTDGLNPDSLQFQRGSAAVAQNPTSGDERFDAELAGLPLAEVVATMSTLLGSGQQSDGVHRLARYLQLHRGESDALGRLLRRDPLSPTVRAAIFLAMELSGTPESERTLSDLLQDIRLQASDRVRAAAALAGTRAHTAEAVSALSAIAGGTTAGSPADAALVAGAALRALGTLAHSAEPASAARAGAEVARAFEQARGVADQLAALDAAHNSGDPRFASAIRELSRSPQPQVRQHAFEAVRKMDPATASALLVPALADEPSPPARRAIAQTLADNARLAEQAPSAEAVAAAVAQLSRETDPAVRAALVELLGNAVRAPSTAAPAAKAALIAQFHRETQPSILVLIGRYCTAAELG